MLHTDKLNYPLSHYNKEPDMLDQRGPEAAVKEGKSRRQRFNICAVLLTIIYLFLYVSLVIGDRRSIQIPLLR